MDCSTLIFTNSGEFLAVPQIFNEADGTVRFDTDEEFTTKLNKQLEELTEINKIKTDGIVATSLPSTPKNDFLLKKFTLANIVDNHFIPFTVLVLTGSRALKQQELTVNEFVNGRYEIELQNATSHWLVQLSKLKMNEVILSEDNFVFDEATITDHNSRGGYDDAEEFGLRFPVVDYGRFIEKKLGIGTADLRPYVSPLWYLRKAFCQIGWQFKSTWLESDRGRREIRYLLSKNVGAAANLLELRKFATHTEEVITFVDGIAPDTVPFYSAIVFDIVDTDANGDYSTITGYYSGAGVMDIHGTLNLSLPNGVLFNLYYNSERYYTAEVVARVCFTVETPSSNEYSISSVSISLVTVPSIVIVIHISS